jgi:hypothetical protein
MKRIVVLVVAGMMLLAANGLAAPKEMNLRVAEPGESTEWTVGAPSNIKWSFRGELGQNVAIRLQRMGWVNAQATVVEATPLGTGKSGTYKWNIPVDLPPGGKYTITVMAENGIGDTSGEFTLTAGKTPVNQITLESPPKGSERWNTGATVSLRWTYSGSPGQMVKLALIKKDDGSVTSIVASIPIGVDGKGHYDWKVPALKSGNDYYVGIASNTNSFYQDLSKEAVSINVAR